MSGRRGRRCAVVLATTLLATAFGSPPPAHADASGFTCTITSFPLLPPNGSYFAWAYDMPGFAENDDEFWRVPLDARASCTRSGSTEPFTVRLTALGPTWSSTPDPELYAGACGSVWFAGGLAAYGGDTSTLVFENPGGLVDRREFETSYGPPDSGLDAQPATFDVDGSTSSAVWNFTYEPGTFKRCEQAPGPWTPVEGSHVARIDVTGSFTVPVAKDNPVIVANGSNVPTHPDPIAVDESAGRIYVGSFTDARAVLTNGSPPDALPSKVFAYDTSMQPVGQWSIAGQTLTKPHGLTGIALDAAGRLYITDIAPPRVVRLDPATGAQTTYATLSNKTPCGSGGPEGDCSSESQSNGDRTPLPNGAAFGPDGSLYVTDTTQGLIWRVPPGGGAAEVWFTSNSLISFIGPNGIRLMPDNRTLLFVHSNSQLPGSTDRLQGAIYKLPINADGTPGTLERFWTGGTNEGPDSLALSAAGNVYVALAGDGVRTGFVVLSPEGKELARRSAPDHNLPDGTSYDTVADVALIGTRALFTNSSNFHNNPLSYAVFRYDAGDRGHTILRPSVP